MNAISLLAAVQRAGIELSIDRGALRYRGRSPALQALLPAIRACRAELTALLADEGEGRSTPSPVVGSPVSDQYGISDQGTLRPDSASTEPDSSCGQVTDLPGVRAWLVHIGEHDPVIVAEVIEKCRTDAAALAYFQARSQEVPSDSSPDTLVDDDRKTCTECFNLGMDGRCLAAARGEIAGAGRIYHPITTRPQRCEGFLPQPDQTDRGSGRER